MLGIGLMAEKPSLLFNAHRIYSWEWLDTKFTEAGFTVLERGEYPVTNDMFLEPGWREGALARTGGNYGFTVLEKKWH